MSVSQTANKLATIQSGTVLVNEAAYSCADNDAVIIVATNSTALALQLPVNPIPGQIVEVVDAGGNAGTNNVTIVDPDGANIDGAASYVINTNGGKVRLAWAGNAYQWRSL